MEGTDISAATNQHAYPTHKEHPKSKRKREVAQVVAAKIQKSVSDSGATVIKLLEMTSRKKMLTGQVSCYFLAFDNGHLMMTVYDGI